MNVISAARLPLALLDADQPRRTALCTRLHQLGHACSAFSSPSELILALGDGRRFGLLLSVLRDEASLGGLRAACLVLGIPVLMVVPGGQWGLLASKTEGLESSGTLGADVSRMADEELDWLIRALIQRASTAPVIVKPAGAEVWGDYHFFEGSCWVQLDGNEISLQPRQFGLALQFFRNVGRVVERDWLWRVLWRTPAHREGNRALDACVSNVRKKLELNGEHRFLLRAVYRLGYQLIEVAPHSSPFTGAAEEQVVPR